MVVQGLRIADVSENGAWMFERDVHSAERVHDWARCKDERRERLFATELVLAYEFGDPEPLAPRRLLTPEAAQRLRDEFASLIAQTGLLAGRHARKRDTSARRAVRMAA